jgi:hypothetical protein
MRQRVCVAIALWVGAGLAGSASLAPREQPPATNVGAAVRPAYQNAAPASTSDTRQALLTRYCVTCHNERLKTANLALDALDLNNVGANAPAWEKVVRKLRAGVMPPSGRPRPDEATHDAFVGWLEGGSIALLLPIPTRGARNIPSAQSIRVSERHSRSRLHRREHRRPAPADDSSYGFRQYRNPSHLPALMERYLSAAKTISRLAIGAPPPAVDHEVHSVVPDAQQHDHVETPAARHARWAAVRHLFPLDGEYDIKLP